ncbi:uncharacterized protein [Henckelia pumila]|uniref:uncharacterized protein n=1 Tax=Henckelia pumila TaxID=405737 RepID=UPI003C6E57FE
MAWIGLYIAAASAVCVISMALDAFNSGFRTKRLWLPCKYFSLNAFSLTLLTVALKLPVDLTTYMSGVDDKITKFSGLALLTTAIGNFMTAMASMDPNEILLNLSALGILIVCTVSVNVWADRGSEQILGDGSNWKLPVCDVCGTSGLMCLLMALTLVETHIQTHIVYNVGYGGTSTSSYKWSIQYIMIIQAAGVALGSIAPVSRWFMAARFKSSKIGDKRFKDEFKIEAYWTHKLVEWRESPLPLQIHHFRCRKVLHGAKRLLLNVAIRIQILVVLVSKLVLLISAKVDAKIFFFFHHIKKLRACAFGRSNDTTRAGSRVVMEQDLSQYVLLLEGEPELPQNTLANICSELDKLIHKGKKQQPKKLIELIEKSVSFNGVREFDSNEVPSLHSQEPPHSWSLAVVTLTSVAVALPNISNHKANWLLTAVSEGLSFVKNIETTFDTKKEFLYIRNAADVTWLEVELYQTWQDNALRETSFGDRTCGETLQELSLKAEKAVVDFKNSLTDSRMENPQNWPVKIIAANAMYRITRTILLAPSNHQTDEQLLEKLSVIISDILAACLTNLSRVITMKCHNDSSKEREENVSQAAILLGESEHILEILEHHQSPGLDPDKAAYMEEWRASILASNDETGIQQINGEHVSIEVES